MAIKNYKMQVAPLALLLAGPVLAEDIGPSGSLLTDRSLPVSLLEIPTVGISQRGLALSNRALGLLEDLAERYGIDRIRNGSPPYPSEFMSEKECASVRVASNRHKEQMAAGYFPDPARELCVFTRVDAQALVLRFAGRSVEPYTVSAGARTSANSELTLRLHVAEPALILVEAFEHAGCSSSGGFAGFEKQDCLHLEELSGSLSTLIQAESVR